MSNLKWRRFKKFHVEVAATANVLLLSACFFMLISNTSLFKPIASAWISCFDCHRDLTPVTTNIIINQHQVMLEIPEKKVREQALLNMQGIYKIELSDAEQKLFNEKGMISVPVVGADKNYHLLPQKVNDNTFGYHPAYGEMFAWIYSARRAAVTIDNKAMHINIKTDDANQPLMQTVFHTLKRQMVLKCKIITDTKEYDYDIP